MTKLNSEVRKDVQEIKEQNKAVQVQNKAVQAQIRDGNQKLTEKMEALAS